MKNMFKRITSAILSLVIVISACSGAMSVFATDTEGAFNYELVEANNVSNVPDAATSLVTSTTVTYKDYNGQTTEYSDESIIPQISDGAFTNFELKSGAYAKNIGGVITLYRDGTIYTDVVHTLGGVCDISDVLVVNRPTGNEYGWISYEIYAGNQRKTLFDGEPIFEYDNTGAKSRTQRFKTTNFKAKYVAMRVTASTSSDELNENWGSSSYTIRMQEFNVYGVKDAEYGKPTEGNELALPESTSVVSSASAKYSNGTENTSAEINFSKYLYNGTLSGRETTVSLTDSPYYDETENYVDITLRLMGEQTINDIYVAHSENADYIPSEYAIYIGDSAETLFSEIPYYTYKSDNPEATQHFEIQGYYASYVGMRIIKPGTDSQIHLREFNVYSDNAVKEKLGFTPTSKIKDKSLIETTYGANILKSENLSVMIDGQKPKDQLTVQNLIGGVIDRQGDQFNENHADINDVGIHQDADIIVELDDYTAVEGFIFQSTKTDNNPYMVSAYQVYIADNREDLFSGEPAFDYNEDNYTLTNGQVVEFPEAIEGKWFAIRIINPTYNPTLEIYGYLRASIILAWGEKAEVKPHQINLADNMLLDAALVSGENVGGTLTRTVNDNSANIGSLPTGTSVIKKAEVYYKAPNAERVASEFGVDNGSADENPLDVLTNGATSGAGSNTSVKVGGTFAEGTSSGPTEIHVNDGEAYADIVYTLDGLCDIQNVNVMSRVNATKWSLSYELYAGNDKDTLFESEPLYVHDNTTEQKNVQVYAGNGLLVKYIAMRITAATPTTELTDYQSINASLIFPRLCEFNVIGTSAKVSDENLTAVEQKNLTDYTIEVNDNGERLYIANTDTYAEIETGNKNLVLNYNLYKDVMVSEISVNTFIDDTHGFETLKVYASDTVEFSDADLVWTYDVAKTGKIDAYTVFNTSKQMRYVRFVFEGTKQNVRINSIDVLGLNAQKTETKNVALNLTSESYVVYQNDTTAGTSKEYSVHPTLLNALADGSEKSFLVLSEGIIGQHTYDVVMNLGGKKTVSNIELSYLEYYRETWPKLINIYLGETKDEAMAKTSPDSVAKDTDVVDGKLSLALNTCFAQYVRLEFKEFNQVPNYIEYLNNQETGRYLITTTLADVKVTGVGDSESTQPDGNYYSVKFVDYDDTVLKTQTVEAGTAAKAPANPIRVGHQFSGWDKDFTNVTENLIVKAQYTLNKYNVTFVDYNGTVLKTQTVEHGAAATAPADPTRVGHTFKDWDKAFTGVTSDLTVTAQYTINSYTVTFVDFYGEVICTRTVAYGANAVPPEAPEVEGHTFTGWLGNYMGITGDVTITAQYEEKTIYITFEDINGVLGTIGVKYGETVDPDDVKILEGKVKDIYGYNIMRDENGNIMWNTNPYEPAVADMTVVVRYQRDTTLSTAVTVTKVNGEKPYDNEMFAYDTAITVVDEQAKSWKMLNTVVATGTTLNLYACGGTMDIYASAKEKAASEVSIVGKANNGTTFAVFAHANPTKTIKKYGFIFSSPTYMDEYYCKEAVRDFTLNDKDAFQKTEAHKKLLQKIEKEANNASTVDFMVPFKCDPTAVRYARAYVVYEDETVAYSNIVCNQEIEADAGELGYEQLDKITDEMED